MGTRSDIIVKRSDNTWARIYCHWDGYLSHNGRILLEHYNTPKKAEKLVASGDLSILAPKCSKPKGHTFSKPVEGYCVYYGRDRGETDCQGETGSDLAAVWPVPDTWTEFTYVFQDGEWFVTESAAIGPSSLVKLSDAMTAVPWSGSPCPKDPDNFWIDDKTGERVNAKTGERVNVKT